MTLDLGIQGGPICCQRWPEQKQNTGRSSWVRYISQENGDGEWDDFKDIWLLNWWAKPFWPSPSSVSQQEAYSWWQQWWGRSPFFVYIPSLKGPTPQMDQLLALLHQQYWHHTTILCGLSQDGSWYFHKRTKMSFLVNEANIVKMDLSL